MKFADFYQRLLAVCKNEDENRVMRFHYESMKTVHNSRWLLETTRRILRLMAGQNEKV